ncbi:MAG: amidohydrolase [bacterium]|nr:amidohydrolase [bacterium]
MDYLFQNATVLTMCDERPVLQNGFVGVAGGKVVYVGETAPEEPAARTIDCRGKFLLPGLVNAHAHTAMCLMRGYADDYTLQTWLYEKVFPVEARLDERAILAGARLGFAEMLCTGTTSASDMYFREPAVAALALECGMRVSLSNAVLAFDEATYDPEKDRAIQETRALIRDFHGAGNGRIRADAAIHAEYTSYPAVWRYVTDIARENGLVLQVHVSETKKEHEECLARRGVTPTRALYDAGVFEAKVLAAHGVWLSDEDMDIFAEAGASVAHCPVSNLKLGSGIARLAEMKRHGMNVALGTDGCCSNNTHDLFEEVKLAALLQKGVSGDPTCVTAYESLKMATVGGAKAQGRENEIGRIAEGFDADLILIDADSPILRPVYDPISTTVYSATGRDVCLTMVQGRILYENGQFTTIDVEQAMHEVEHYAVPIVRGTAQ